ncbi:MAG: glycoside hydrolase family 3 C-terminal domain-containing protein [Acidobacteria bacterium]|nr:glycoside hydrolase family 3 C-terminal domain-containing protein [Acidobacteriota bacterium]
MSQTPAKSLVAMIVFASVGLAASPPDPPQLGKSPLREVIAAMTPEEKAAIVVGTGMNLPPGMSAGPGMQAPVVGETIKGVPGAAGTTFPIARLGIPAVILADGPAGLRIQPKRPGEESRTYYCTAFPIATLLASSWDVELLERVGRAMGSEVREYGVDVLLGPALNIHRNPLGGRNFEYYSEDPLLSGKLAAAMTRGVQSQGVGTSAKHFVANDHEWNRNVIDVKVSQRALREIYLRPFEILVREAQPWTVMSSYNRLNGTYTSESAPLLNGVLREDWGFEGLVMTDWFGGRDPVAQMKAGNDLLEPGTAAQQQAVLAALKSGALPPEVLDRNVERVLSLVLRSPTFKNATRSNQPDLAANAAVGRDAAAQGMVLLKNEGALPLPRPAKTIALFGNTSYDMITGGSGSGDVNEAYTVSLVQGLEAAGLAAEAKLAAAYSSHLQEFARTAPPPRMFMAAPRAAEMSLAPADIARAAKESDAGLVTIGRNAGEGRDREVAGDFELTAVEKALIAEVASAFHANGKKALVVLNVAGVVETASWRDLPDAILLAWQPGQESGHAIADVITGKVTPSGKLATTFPMKYQDVPSASNFPGKTLVGPDPAARGGNVFGRGDREAEIAYEDDVLVGYRHYATKDVKVAYPFGFGLSYTAFEYSGLSLSGPEFGTGLTVKVTVRNTGKVAGREAAQLYLSAPGKTMLKPAIELKGFAKTKVLAPGESQTLAFQLTPRDLASFDEATSSWQAEAGTYTVRIGASSADIRQTATFTKATTERVE